MTLLDWVLFGAVVFSVLMAALRGFLYETFSLAGVVVGFLAAAWGYPRLSPWFQQWVQLQPIADFGSFCAIFIVVTLIAGAAGEIVRAAAKKVGLSPVDRVLGGAFGLVRGVLFGAVVVLAIATFRPESKLIERSALGGHFLLAAKGIALATPPEVRARFREGVAAIRKAAQGEEPQTGAAPAKR